MKLLFLALFWSLWCALHSFLISQFVISRLRDMYGARFRYYRIFYNLFSAVTLVPVLVYSRSLGGDLFFVWSGVWRPVRLALTLSALALFYAGSRHYDLRQFLGLRQVAEYESRKSLSESGGLDTSGILGVIRHPWYTAAIIMIWARPLDGRALVTNIVLSAYLFIGTVLEERKLVTEFGDEYRKYQEKVPMFFPGGKGRDS